MEKIANTSITLISLITILGSISFLCIQPEQNVDGLFSWREVYNSKHSASFDSEYYIAWETERLFQGRIPDNLRIDGNKNSYALRFDDSTKLYALVSYDINGNKRFEFPLGYNVTYSFPIVTVSNEIIIFINTTLFVLNDKGTVEVQKEFKDCVGKPTPRLTEMGDIIFTLKKNGTVYRYIVDIRGIVKEKIPIAMNETSISILFSNDGNIIMMDSNSIRSVSKNGSIIWNKRFDGNWIAWGVNAKGNVCLIKDNGMIHLDKNGKETWNLTLKKRERIDAFTIDQDGNFIIVVFDFYTSHGAKIMKLDENGAVLWEKRGPIATRSLFLDKDGNVIIAGKDWIVEMDNDGNILSQIFKSKNFCYTFVTMIDNDTLLMTDSLRIICMKKFPYKMNLTCDQPLIGDPKVRLVMNPLYMENVPIIKNIKLYVIDDSDTVIYVNTYPGDCKSFTIYDPPGDRYEVKLELILESGETIIGPMIMIQERDKTILYVGIWVVFTILPLLFLALGVVIVNRSMKKREKDAIDGTIN